MTNDNSQPYFSWSWKNKPPSSPRTAKWEKSQNPNSKSQIAKPISAKLSPVSLSPFLSLFTQSFFSTSLPMTNDQLSCSFFLCRKKNQKRQRLKNISRGFVQSQRMEFKAQKLSSSYKVSDIGKGYGYLQKCYYSAENSIFSAGTSLPSPRCS